MMQVEATIISLFDEQNEKISFSVANHMQTEDLLKIERDPQSGLLKQVIEDNEIYVNNNAKDDPHHDPEFEKHIRIDVKQCIIIPLAISGKVIGIIEVFNKFGENEFFRQEDIRLFHSIAGQIARGLENYGLREEKTKADRLASIGNMMSAIVHDLRTPINNIQGFVELMQEEDEADTRDEYAEIVHEQVQLLTNMTTDVLQFAKGKTTILPVKIAADKLLSRFEKLYRNDVLKKGYEFEVTCDLIAMIYIDAEKILRVFMNIMKNALEAMEPGGKFSLRASLVENEVEFILKDTGKGIPLEIQNKLFDSFVTSGKEGGTGLGLAIVKKIVEEHNGRIEVESAPGQGSTSKIYLKKL